MPGAWEIKAARQVLCAILHVDTTTIAWSMGFRNLRIPGEVIGLAGMPFDHARNSACRICLDNGFDWLFFLDSDVIPPSDAVYRLMAHQYPVISGMYCRRSPPHGVPVMIKNGQWHQRFTPGEVVDVDLVGAGCLLIHRSVLERLPPSDAPRGKHWFDWRVDMQGLVPQGEALSEDFTFCVNVKRHLGITTKVDTSIACRHVGLAQATHNSLIPCEATALT